MNVKNLLIILCSGFVATTTVADEAQRSPRETFVAYFQAMEARNQDVAKALKAPECSDSLHMNIHKLDIVDRLQPFYELSTPKRALVVAHPFTTSAIPGRDEVVYAELLKLGGSWRIQLLNRTSPENASWLMKGFQVHPDVNLDLSPQALVGEWSYPCASTVVLTADGTGSDLEVGPAGPFDGQKPERFTWDVKGSILSLRFADRERQLIVTSIDHGHVDFKKPNKRYWGSWRRKQPSEVEVQDDPRLAELIQDLHKLTNQVTVCNLPGVLSDDFQEFVRSQGVRTSSPGGDESHSITVYEGDREKFFTIADTPEVIERFGLMLVRDQIEGEQAAPSDGDKPPN